MGFRVLPTVAVAGVCLAASPAPPPPVSPASAASPDPVAPPTGRLPTAAEFADLVRADPVAALAASVQRYRAEVRGYRAVLHKHERVRGILYPPEVVRLAVRDSPYAVCMVWEQGARSVLGADVMGVLFAAGENGGRLKAWRPKAWIKLADTSPTDEFARSSARYSLTEAGLAHAADRTRRAWAAARDAGQLRVEFLGTRKVGEVGGRACHAVRRTCDPPTVDPFLTDEPPPDPAKYPADAAATVTVYLDAETWLQVGSELRRADGELVGSYFFRDVQLNPAFPPNQFTSAAFKQ